MTIVDLVRGPEWVAAGLDESAGLYPLRVEPAVGRLVERLLPGVITTTTGARYYGLHTLAWADARQRDLDGEAAEEFVRRCEVVTAAVSLRHREFGHLRRLPAAHGEDQIPPGALAASPGPLPIPCHFGDPTGATWLKTQFAPYRVSIRRC